MSEMELLDLAPGDPISQGGSLRGFRYSQFSQCPSAPFNTAEPECLPSLFHLSPSSATSPLLEFEGRKYMLSDGGLGGPSSSFPCSQRKSNAFAEGVKCNSKCEGHLQSGSSISDSLELSFLDVHPGSKERESSPQILQEETHAPDVGVSGSAAQDSPLHSPIQRSPRRIYCDSRLLEEETQVFAVGVLDSKQQDSQQDLEGITQNSIGLCYLDDKTTAAELEKSLSVHGEMQGCHVAAEDFADICHRWHNRRRIAPSATALLRSSACTGLPSEATHEIIKPSTSSVLDADHFRGQAADLEPENSCPSCATNQTTSAAIKDDVGTVRRCHYRRRISLAALTNLNSSTKIRLPVETKQEIIKPSTSEMLDADCLRCQPTVVEPENASPSTSPSLKISAAVEDDADIVQRWRNRKRVALFAITNLSSSSDKKLKQTPDKSVELGARLHSELEDLVVKGPLCNDNENRSVPQRGYDIPCLDAISARSGSETIEEDVNVNDDKDDCCDSKLFRRKLNYSCTRDIKSYLQPVTARNKSTRDLSSTNEAGISKQEHAEEKWTYPKKNRVGARQRTMDAWIK